MFDHDWLTGSPPGSDAQAGDTDVDLRAASSLHLDVLQYEQGKAVDTIRNYRLIETRFIDWIAEQRGRAPTDRDLTEGMLLLFLQWLRTVHTSQRWGGTEVGHSPGNVRFHVVILKAWTSFLYRRKILRRDPFALIRTPSAPKRLQSSLTYDEVMLLVDLCARTQEKFRNEAIVLFLYETGVRISELTGLRRADLELLERGRQTGRAKVSGKGSRERYVTFGQRTSAAIRTYWRMERSQSAAPWVFLGRDGDQLTRRMVDALLKELAERAHFQKTISPHTLRRAFAYEFLRQNPGRLEDLRIRMGHASLNQSLEYARHIRAEEGESIPSLVDRRKGRKPPPEDDPLKRGR